MPLDKTANEHYAALLGARAGTSKSGLEPETLAIRSDQLSYESSCWPLQLLGLGFRLHFVLAHLKSAHHSQSARVIKGWT